MNESEISSVLASCDGLFDWKTMTDLGDYDVKHREEVKREAQWEASQRWRVIQETIAWAEAQATVRRNTRQRCLELQQAKLASR